MSVPSFLCMGNDVQGNYSFLGGRVDEDNEEGRSGDIELKPLIIAPFTIQIFYFYKDRVSM